MTIDEFINLTREERVVDENKCSMTLREAEYDYIKLNRVLHHVLENKVTYIISCSNKYMYDEIEINPSFKIDTFITECLDKGFYAPTKASHTKELYTQIVSEARATTPIRITHNSKVPLKKAVFISQMVRSNDICFVKLTNLL
jgi:hypothetical protein